MRWCLLLLVLWPAAALAQERRALLDGAPMVVTVDGDSIEVRYAEPGAALRELGVTPATPLVRGRWVGGIFTGEAFVFAPRCPPIGYPVRGMVDSGGALLVLGPAPSAVKDCRAEALTWNASSILRFEQPAGERRPAARPEAKAKPKARPKPAPKPVARPAPPRPQLRQPWENAWPWQWR